MPPAYGVRRANPNEPSDVLSIAALRRAWTEERWGDEIDDPMFEDRFTAWHEHEQGQRITWLGDADGQPAGMLNLVVFTRMPRPIPTGEQPGSRVWGYIANMFVLAEHRNGGLGSQLLDAAVEHATANDYARLVLTPTEQAIPFYARAGFVPATMLMVRPGD